MIGASDQVDGKRRTQLLDTAMDFAVWLENMPPEIWDRRISKLNRLQIIKRNRPFSEEENKEILQILATSTENYDIMVGANILLERFSDADFWLDKMPTDTQNEFKKFPIFHLWKMGKAE